MKESNKNKFVFFGTSDFATGVLEELKEKNLLPSLIVTTKAKPQGRKMEEKPSHVFQWAEKENIPVITPTSLKDEQLAHELKSEEAQFFVVVDYGKIIPKSIFEIPPKRTINVHPSLLPNLRGSSPIEYTILENKIPAITTMLISEEMDAGPILLQKEFPKLKDQNKTELTKNLAREGGKLLVETIEKWLSADIKPTEQNHNLSTYAPKILKGDGEINLEDSAEMNMKKMRAYSGWPGVFTIFKNSKDKEIRIIIKEAEINEGKFTPTKVIPEGKKEMQWDDFLRGNL